MSNNRDESVNFTSVKFGENSKGNLRVQLYVSKEDAENLAASIVQKASEGTGTGVQLDIHQTLNTVKDTGKEFISACMFVKSKMARQQDGQRSGSYGGGKSTYKPKGNSQADVIARLKQKQVN